MVKMLNYVIYVFTQIHTHSQIKDLNRRNMMQVSSARPIKMLERTKFVKKKCEDSFPGDLQMPQVNLSPGSGYDYKMRLELPVVGKTRKRKCPTNFFIAHRSIPKSGLDNVRIDWPALQHYHSLQDSSNSPTS